MSNWILSRLHNSPDAIFSSRGPLSFAGVGGLMHHNGIGIYPCVPILVSLESIQLIIALFVA